MNDPKETSRGATSVPVEPMQDTAHAPVHTSGHISGHVFGHTPSHDLEHFLRLASAQVRHRLTRTERPDAATASRLHLLEELIKEQIPDENSGSTARSAR